MIIRVDLKGEAAICCEKRSESVLQKWAAEKRHCLELCGLTFYILLWWNVCHSFTCWFTYWAGRNQSVCIVCVTFCFSCKVMPWVRPQAIKIAHSSSHLPHNYTLANMHVQRQTSSCHINLLPAEGNFPAALPSHTVLRLVAWFWILEVLVPPSQRSWGGQQGIVHVSKLLLY